MYCLDSNIIIRCITGDDPIQSPKALAFLKKAISAKQDIYVPDVVVLEVAWVLQKRYAFSPARVREALEPLVMDPALRFDHPHRLTHALETFCLHPLSLHDAYIAGCASESADGVVVTFDRDFQSLPVRSIVP